MTLLLSRSDILGISKPEDAIGVAETCFCTLAEGKAKGIDPLMIELAEGDSRIAIRPGCAGTFVSLKLNALCRKNPGRNLPLIRGVVALFSADTGEVLALMDSGSLTAVRTGATGALGVKYMARPEATVLSLIGAGEQGRAQALSILRVREIREVRIFDTMQHRAEALANEIAGEVPTARVCHSVRDAVAGSDICVTATTSREPVLERPWIGLGVHINAIGAHGRGSAELDAAILREGRIVVDSLQESMQYAGDLLEAMQAGVVGPQGILGEMKDLVTGLIQGRVSPEDITVFRSVGSAAQDVSCATWLYEQAKQRGIGLEIQLED